ncbi:hypothetical protein JHK87_048019 [Glycine soja]|nr:hypothetical protein JHK87_048019 [Glycine soja]
MVLYQVLSVVGLLQDEVDPMVFVMKVEKAPLESYVDIGGLDAQIQEIKEAVKLPLTHPELYEDIRIKPPKGVILYGEPGTGKTLLAKGLISYLKSRYQHVESKRATMRLEQGSHSCIERAIDSHGAFSILYSRHSKHYIKKPEVLLGRATQSVPVDIDLGINGGHVNAISRRHVNKLTNKLYVK